MEVKAIKETLLQRTQYTVCDLEYAFEPKYLNLNMLKLRWVSFMNMR